MKAIRENIFEVTYTEIGSPIDKGVVKTPDGGRLHFNDGDLNYAKTHAALGYEPTFFIKASPAMGGDWVVVGRQQKA